MMSIQDGIQLSKVEIKKIEKFNKDNIFIGELIDTKINEKNCSVEFLVKCLCKESELIEKINKSLSYEDNYIGQDANNLELFKCSKLDSVNKINDSIVNILKNKLILFKPNITCRSKTLNGYRERYKVYKNLNIISLHDKEYADKEYKEIKIINLTINEFEEKLVNKKSIKIDGESPEYILCENKLYTLNPQKWTISKNKSLIYEGEKQGVYDFAGYEDKGIKYNDRLLVSSIQLESILENTRNEIDKETKIIESIKKEEIIVEEKKEILEIDFIKNLQKRCLEQNLFYKDKDLLNFHICMKTNFLTILAGMSGTGKSKLARIYSEVLNLYGIKKKILFIPISPTYTEPADILGYYNANTCLYQAPESKLLETLIEAEKNPNNFYTIVFDEMNLAQIEHWFSPFISLLEEKEENRILTLYSPEQNCINKFIYPSEVKIGNNIRFIGTINLDETTKDISDRVLDRSNIIKLEKLNFIDCKKINEKKQNKNTEIEFIDNFYEQFYKNWIYESTPFEIFNLKELEFFDELHNLISKYDYEKGVSFRVIEHIGNYVNNIPMDKNKYILERQDAIDIQVCQRIISKLKGGVELLKELIGEFDFEKKEILNGQLQELLIKYASISNFEKTLIEITKKSKELAIYGYTN